jgi:hypothetical protein
MNALELTNQRQLLIWHLEENNSIQISRLVGRTQKQKENISLKKTKKNKNRNHPN